MISKEELVEIYSSIVEGYSYESGYPESDIVYAAIKLYEQNEKQAEQIRVLTEQGKLYEVIIKNGIANAQSVIANMGEYNSVTRKKYEPIYDTDDEVNWIDIANEALKESKQIGGDNGKNN